MNKARITALVNGLTSVARRVYDAVPIDEPWSLTEIGRELKRLTHQTDFKVMSGCLQSLVQSGLIKEPSTGSFVRVQVRETKAVRAPVSAPEMGAPLLILPPRQQPVSAPMPTPKEPDVLDVLAALGKEARDIQTRLQGVLNEVGNFGKRVDDAALMISEQFETANADGAKLRQLQSLLKSLT